MFVHHVEARIEPHLAQLDDHLLHARLHLERLRHSLITGGGHVEPMRSDFDVSGRERRLADEDAVHEHLRVRHVHLDLHHRPVACGRGGGVNRGSG